MLKLADNSFPKPKERENEFLCSIALFGVAILASTVTFVLPGARPKTAEAAGAD